MNETEQKIVTRKRARLAVRLGISALLVGSAAAFIFGMNSFQVGEKFWGGFETITPEAIAETWKISDEEFDPLKDRPPN